MRQIEKEPEVDAISLDNIDIFSKWRVEVEVSLLDEAHAWLEEREQGAKQQQQEEQQVEEELHPYTMEDDVPLENETPSSTQFGEASPPSIIDRHIVDA
jgi:hypothetical protein